MKVVVFSTPDCVNCKPLKASLQAAGIEFEEVNCHEPDSFALMRVFGIRSVPTTIIRDEEGATYTVLGNKPQEIRDIVQ